MCRIPCILLLHRASNVTATCAHVFPPNISKKSTTRRQLWALRRASRTSLAFLYRFQASTRARERNWRTFIRDCKRCLVVSVCVLCSVRGGVGVASSVCVGVCVRAVGAWLCFVFCVLELLRIILFYFNVLLGCAVSAHTLS